MTTQNIISKTNIKFLFLGLLFCVFSISLSQGQSEARGVITGEKVNEVPYHPQTPEKQLVKSTDKSEKRSFSGYSREENVSEGPDYPDINDKDVQNGETSSEEVSTLSFNIFLYVLDRFKED